MALERKKGHESGKPIDISEIPTAVQDVFEEFRALATKEEWRAVTEGMNQVTQKSFIGARAMSQKERNESAKKLIKEWKELLEDETHPEHSVGQMLLPFCLSDESLDLAISTFLPSKMN